MLSTAWSATWTGGMLYSRFGVTLETEEYDLDPGSGTALVNRFKSGIWTPSADPNAAAGVERAYIVDDYYGYRSLAAVDSTTADLFWGGTVDGNTSNKPGTYTRPSRGEGFDTEAIYMTNDERALYIAIVTSTPPPPGIVGPLTIPTGDVALHTPDDVSIHSGEYAYGIDLNESDRPLESANTGSTVVGNKMYKTDYDGPESGTDDWYVGTPTLAVSANLEETNFYGGGLASEAFVGDINDGLVVKYLNTELLEGYEPGTTDPYASTWEVNIIIPLSLLPEYQNLEYGESKSIGLTFIPGCRNDGAAGIANIRLDYEYHDVPEPGTFIMMGLGLAGMVWWKRRRKAAEPE